MKPTILVVRFSSLGDIVLTSAPVLNLKFNFPDSRLVYLTKERFHPIVRMFDGVDEVVCLSDDAGLVDYYKLMLSLDRQHFHLLVDLHANQRSWLARKLISADRMSAYPKRRVERRLIARRRNKQIPRFYPHTIDLYNEALRRLQLETYVSRPVLPYHDSSHNVSERPTVVMAPGAAHPPKRFPASKFADVARMMQKGLGAHIIWAATDQDPGLLEMATDLDRDGVTELVNHPVPALTEIIRAADITVANDSGIAHVSSAVGTPVVALFGPTHPALGFAPRGLRDQIVDVELWCRPCSLHGSKPCFREEQYCFSKISADRVYEVASEILRASRAASPALFLDRDGTVIKEKHFLSDPDKVELEDGVPDALRQAMGLGYRLVILSNQSGVARGYFDETAVERVNGRVVELLAREGVEIDAVYYCPFYQNGTVPSYAVRSELRKPAPGMAEAAARDLNIDLRKSVVIGDRLSDVNLGRAIGARSFLLKTGYGKKTCEEFSTIRDNEKVVCDSLAGVIERLRKDD